MDINNIYRIQTFTKALKCTHLLIEFPPIAEECETLSQFKINTDTRPDRCLLFISNMANVLSG